VRKGLVRCEVITVNYTRFSAVSSQLSAKTGFTDRCKLIAES
jgi:hypothetical protein